MSFEEVADKSRGSIEFVGRWPRARTEEVLAVVKELEAVPDVADLVKAKLTIRQIGL